MTGKFSVWPPAAYNIVKKLLARLGSG